MAGLKGPTDSFIKSVVDGRATLIQNIRLATEFAQQEVERAVAPYREMLSKVSEVRFDGYRVIQRLGKETYEYGLIVDGEYGRGDYSSIEEAYADMKEHENETESITITG